MGQPFNRPKVDARLFKDMRSRGYGVRTIVAPQGELTKRLWPIPSWLPLDQGQEGACVGFGWSAELAVEPVSVPVTNGFALRLYHAAQAIDKAEGRDYPDGATTLAGAKAAKNMGLISAYRWCFGIDEVTDALVVRGPVVLGINWYDGMYETDTNGLVSVNGPLVGGHCISLTGYWPYKISVNGRSTKDNSPFGQDVYEWVNSWGKMYGRAGVGFIRRSDLDRLLKEDGEAVIATDIAPQPEKPRWRRILDNAKREFHI